MKVKATKYGILIWLLMMGAMGYAQEVQFNVDAPSQVEQGTQFNITFTVNQEGDFNGPNFTEFQLLGGPSVSNSTSMQIINGRTSSSTSKSYTYYLKASNIGKYRLPVATFKFKDKEYQSAALSIEVVKSVNTQTNNGSGQAAVTNPEFKADGVVFVKTMVDKHSVFMGEPINITQKLYSKERVANITGIKEPSYTDFWKEDIDIGELKLSQEVINGVAYNVVLLKKSILFPQKSGTLEIGSIQLDAILQIVKKRKARDRFEQMMYGNVLQYYDNQEVSINSPVVKISVRELPANKPKNFNGVVGDFKMETEIDKTELKTNDAFNLKIKISGKGNVDLLEAPDINFPPDFEVYDPKISKSSKNSSTGVIGDKTYEYLIIPRNEGDFNIPTFGFSYFNPQSERYESCQSPEYTIKVNRGEGQSNTNSSIGGAVNRDDVKYVGKDIRYIMLNPGNLTPINSHCFNSWKHLLFLLVSPFLALGIILLLKNSIKKRSNTSLMRLKKATKAAQKRLKVARKLMETNKETEFYEETSKAIWGYISDKFNLNLAELSMDSIQQKLADHEVENENIEAINQLLHTCEYARYAPSANKGGMNDLYQKAINTISRIEKSLK